MISHQPRGRMTWTALAILAATFIGLGWYIHSERFHAFVRQKVVQELEDATGGEVELRSFTWRLLQLEFVAEDLTIHGLEGRDVAPYAHIDYLKVRLKIISLFRQEIGLAYVEVRKPAFHIFVNPDGSTNQPTPKIKRLGKSPLDQLFDLAIDRLEMSEGVLLWNDHRIPLDFTADDVSLGLSFNAAKISYSADLKVGKAYAKYREGRPLAMNAELAVDLSRDLAKIKALKVSTPGSRLEASGQLSHFQKPKFDVTYRASLNLQEIAQAAGVPQISAGTLDLEGEGTAAPAGFNSSGRLALHSLAIHNEDINLAGLSIASPFTVTRERLTLPALKAELLDGKASGKVEVQNWLNQESVADRPQRQRGGAELIITGVDLDRALTSLSSKRLPLSDLKAAGVVEGKVGATWLGSPHNTKAELDLKIVAPAQVPADRLPVHARFEGIYDLQTQSLSLQTARLGTRNIELTASGSAAQTNELKIALTATSVSELEPLFRAMGTKMHAPIEIHGKASFKGVLRGRLNAPVLQGHLQIDDFDLLLANQGPTTDSRRIHWDSLSSDLDYRQESIGIQNGHLRRSAALIDFAGNSTLPKGKFGEASVFSANIDVNNAEFTDLQGIAGYAYPITGSLNGRINARGTTTSAQGVAQFTIGHGTLYAEPFKDLRADLDLNGKNVRLRSFSLSQNGANVAASGTYNLATQLFQLLARGRDFDLGHIQKFQSSRLSLTGHGGFDLNASGTLENPIVQARLEIRDIIANGESIGDVHADAITRGRELQLTARSQLENATLAMEGKVELNGNFPTRATINFENLDFDPVLRAFLENRISGHSSMNGRIEMSGPLKQPKLLVLRGLVTQLSAEIEKIRLSNAAPIEFSYAGQIAKIQQLHLRGEGTDIKASGRVNLVDQRLDIQAQGDVNLKLVEAFYPDLLSYGTVGIQLSVGGTINAPVPVGQIAIQNAGVSIIDLPNGLANINGILIFNENRLQVQSLSANTGGGTLNIGGFISYKNGVYFDLTARGREIRLRYPAGISAAANADLRYAGTIKSSMLSGDVLVTRFGVNPRFDFALYLARGKNPPTAPKANPVLDNLRLDVHVTSTPELRVETQLAKIAGDADLRIRGTASHPAVLGRVNIAEGDIFFNSTKYHLERGDVSFNNPVRIEPILNVEASARVREYDITIGFHGSIDKLNTTYRSEPPLPTADIIALLALGRTREDAVLNPPAQQNFAETASNAILGQALDAALSSRVQKLFGVSRIKIDPQVGGPETATGARITIEQQVSNNVTLTYITNVARANQQIIQGEFNFTRDLSLVIVRDENGVLGFDFRIRQRKR